MWDENQLHHTHTHTHTHTHLYKEEVDQEISRAQCSFPAGNTSDRFLFMVVTSEGDDGWDI